MVSKGKERQAEIRKLYQDMPITSGKVNNRENAHVVHMINKLSYED